MERFRKMMFSIQNLSLEVAMHHLVTALILDPFSDSLCKKPTSNKDELQQRATKFMQLKELHVFRRKVHGVEGSHNYMDKKGMERAPRSPTKHREYS